LTAHDITTGWFVGYDGGDGNLGRTT